LTTIAGAVEALRVLDTLLVRHGALIGWLLSACAGAAAALVARALLARPRRAALDATFGASEALDERAIGRAIVLEGVLTSETPVARHADGRPCVASTVRTNDAASEPLASRAAGARLAVGGTILALDGPLEVVAGSHERLLSGASRDALLGELARGAGASPEAGPLVAHAVQAGDRVRVAGLLARAEDGYRHGALVLRADAQRAIRLAASAPSLGRLAPRAAAVGLVTLALVVGFLQAAASGALRSARASYFGGARGTALPLSGAHRLALLGTSRHGALALFESIVAADRPTPELLALAADAHAVRGDCSAGLAVLGRHGLFNAARARAARCRTARGARVLAVIERSDGRLDEALRVLEPQADAVRALEAREATRGDYAWWGLLPQLYVEAGRYEDAVRALARATERPFRTGRAGACAVAALRASAGEQVPLPHDEGLACTLTRLELEGGSAEEWQTSGLWRTGQLGALASDDDAPLGGWADVGGVSDEAIVRAARLPRWDGLAREALAGARQRTELDASGARCQLAEAEALHAHRRTGAEAEAPDGCRFEQLHALAALEHGTLADDTIDEGIAYRISRFRETPELGTLRDLEEALSEGSPSRDGSRDPEELAREEARERAEPPSRVEAAAAEGDGRVLERMFGARIAALAASSHREDVFAWLRLRERDLGWRWIGIDRLREEAYDDLWIARALGDDEAAEQAGARVDRLSAVLDDRRRVVLLEILASAR
jgi:tetratricopeptide (TPR) repeat protein